MGLGSNKWLRGLKEYKGEPQIAPSTARDAQRGALSGLVMDWCLDALTRVGASPNCDVPYHYCFYVHYFT